SNMTISARTTLDFNRFTTALVRRPRQGGSYATGKTHGPTPNLTHAVLSVTALDGAPRTTGARQYRPAAASTALLAARHCRPGLENAGINRAGLLPAVCA